MKRVVLKACLIGFLGFLWLSVPTISLGTFVQSRSPACRLAESEAIDDILWLAVELHVEKAERRAGVGLGWGVAHHWLFVGLLGAMIAWAYTLGLQAVRVVVRQVPEVGQPLAAAFGILCLTGSGFLLWLARFGPDYQPGLLTVGYCVGALGLVFGTFVAGYHCRIGQQDSALEKARC